MTEYLFPLPRRYDSMSSTTRYVILIACTITLIMACMFAGCSSYQSAPSSPPAAPTLKPDANSITIEKFAFNPATLTVKPGSSVTWTNRDGVDHTIVTDSGSPVQFKSENLANGASFSFTFAQPGTYTYRCSIHPSMKGTVLVQ